MLTSLWWPLHTVLTYIKLSHRVPYTSSVVCQSYFGRARARKGISVFRSRSARLSADDSAILPPLPLFLWPHDSFRALLSSRSCDSSSHAFPRALLTSFLHFTKHFSMIFKLSSSTCGQQNQFRGSQPDFIFNELE